MGRSPCCDELEVKKGPWSVEEDKKLVEYIQKNGHGSWRNLPKRAGLNRCGKSCRLRWTNYLRPDIKRGKFSEDEERLIVHLHSILGNKWSTIAGHLRGRTDNEIKNYWNTHLKRKLLLMGIDPVTHQRRADMDILASLPSILVAAAAAAAANAAGGVGGSNVLGDLMVSNPLENACRLQAADAAILARYQMLQALLQVLSSNPPANTNALGLLSSSSSSPCSNQLNYQQFEGPITNVSQMNLTPSLSCMTSSSTQPDLPNHISMQEQAMVHAQCLGSSARAAATMDERVGTHVHPSLRSYATVPTAQSTPSLVSASPDCMEDTSNSSASTPLEGLHGSNPGALDDDQYWTEILDQLSWSNEL